MDQARDLTTNALVRATAARRSGRYVCPECRAPVSLRGGTGLVTKYFAHRRNQADEQCSLYFPGSGMAGDTRRVLRDWALLPSVRVRHQRIGRIRRWTLVMRLPALRPADLTAVGEFLVRDGAVASVRVPCRLLERPYMAELRPVTGTYAVGVPQALRYLYGDQRSVHVAALEAGCPTLFRGGESGGRRLGDGAPLLWGRPYYAVCPPGVAFQPPGGISFARLTGPHPFQGFWFEFPDAPDPAVLKWAEEVLDRSVEHPQVNVTLVSPAGAVGRDDDAVLVDAGEEAVVAVVRERGALMPPVLSVFWHEKIETADIPITPSSESPDIVFVALGRVRPGRTLLSVGDDEEELLILEGRRSAPALLPTQPLLATTCESGTVTSYPVSSLAAAEMLAESSNAPGDEQGASRRQAGTGVRFALPRRGWCVIRTQASGQGASYEEVVRWPQPSPSPPEDPRDPTQEEARAREALAQIEAALSTRLARAAEFRAERVEFDFGAFGRLVVAPAEQRANVPALPPLATPLRQRVQWCLAAHAAAASPTGTNNDHVRLAGMEAHLVLANWWKEAKDRAPSLSAEDRMLLERLAGTQRWPAALVPHLTTLVDALTRWAPPTKRTRSGTRLMATSHRR